MSKVGIAIVGCGRAGQFHMTSMAACADVAELVYVVDVHVDTVEKMAAKKGCKAATDIKEVLSDPAVDAVVVASTTNTHYEICKLALKADKAVFTEKPISHKPEELREIIDLAIAKKRAFIVGYQRRIDPNFAELQRVVKDGALGQLRMLKCCSRDNPMPPMPYLAVSGGIFYDMLTHDFDMIHFLSGEMPTEVYTAGHCYNESIREIDDIDTVMVTLKFKSGLIACVDCSRVAEYGYDQRVEAFGEKGMATAENVKENTVVVASSAGHVHPKNCHSFPQRYKHVYTDELVSFVQMVKSNEIAPIEDTRRHIELERVTAAAELSHRLGRAIQVDEVEALRKHLPH